MIDVVGDIVVFEVVNVDDFIMWEIVSYVFNVFW